MSKTPKPSLLLDSSPSNPSQSTSNPALHKPPTLRSAYTPRLRVALSFSGSGRTKQNFKDECDINTILSRFQRTGNLTHTSSRTPRYEDVADLDFHGAMQLVAGANGMFSELPAKIRDRFANDPGRLLEFLQDPENRAEALKLGLLAPSPTNVDASVAPAASPQASGGGSSGEPPPKAQ